MCIYIFDCNFSCFSFGLGSVRPFSSIFIDLVFFVGKKKLPIVECHKSHLMPLTFSLQGYRYVNSVCTIILRSFLYNTYSNSKYEFIFCLNFM